MKGPQQGLVEQHLGELQAWVDGDGSQLRVVLLRVVLLRVVLRLVLALRQHGQATCWLRILCHRLLLRPYCSQQAW